MFNLLPLHRYPGEVTAEGEPYFGIEVDILVRRALRAFYEWNPITDNKPIYKSVRYGKHLEVFLLDFRSYRDANPLNNSTEPIEMMGKE